MAFCFLAVIILSFFTGIAIGYIIFEFYIMNRNGINFNYVEGEEVNSFLEEIRRSKDNGARMLNYKTNTRNSTDAVLVRNEGSRPISTASRVESLSSRLRKNLNNQLEGYEEVVSTEENVEEVVETTETQDTLQTELTSHNIEDTYDAMSEEYNEDEDASEEDFVVDDEYLKKYYITEDDDIPNGTSNLEDGDILNIEEQNDTVADVAEAKTDLDTETDEYPYIDTEMYSSDDFRIEPEFDTESDTVAETSDTDTSIAEDIEPNDKQEIETGIKTNVDEVSDKIVANTAIELPKSDKQDKIVSNVCIQLGGTPKKDDSGSSFVAIPLTMTEKPVEPDAPPKRKRGRPRKKK